MPGRTPFGTSVVKRWPSSSLNRSCWPGFAPGGQMSVRGATMVAARRRASGAAQSLCPVVLGGPAGTVPHVSRWGASRGSRARGASSAAFFRQPFQAPRPGDAAALRPFLSRVRDFGGGVDPSPAVPRAVERSKAPIHGGIADGRCISSAAAVTAELRPSALPHTASAPPRPSVEPPSDAPRAEQPRRRRSGAATTTKWPSARSRCR